MTLLWRLMNSLSFKSRADKRHEQLLRKCPSPPKFSSPPYRGGKVVAASPFRDRVLVFTDTGAIFQVQYSELDAAPRFSKLGELEI